MPVTTRSVAGKTRAQTALNKLLDDANLDPEDDQIDAGDVVPVFDVHSAYTKCAEAQEMAKEFCKNEQMSPQDLVRSLKSARADLNDLVSMKGVFEFRGVSIAQLLLCYSKFKWTAEDQRDMNIFSHRHSIGANIKPKEILSLVQSLGFTGHNKRVDEALASKTCNALVYNFNSRIRSVITFTYVQEGRNKRTVWPSWIPSDWNGDLEELGQGGTQPPQLRATTNDEQPIVTNQAATQPISKGLPQNISQVGEQSVPDQEVAAVARVVDSQQLDTNQNQPRRNKALVGFTVDKDKIDTGVNISEALARKLQDMTDTYFSGQGASSEYSKFYNSGALEPQSRQYGFEKGGVMSYPFIEHSLEPVQPNVVDINMYDDPAAIDTMLTAEVSFNHGVSPSARLIAESMGLVNVVGRHAAYLVALALSTEDEQKMTYDNDMTVALLKLAVKHINPENQDRAKSALLDTFKSHLAKSKHLAPLPTMSNARDGILKMVEVARMERDEDSLTLLNGLTKNLLNKAAKAMDVKGQSKGDLVSALLLELKKSEVRSVPDLAAH